MTAVRLALDHNFSPTIVAALAKYIPEADLVPIGAIDQRMPLLEDWQVLVALRHHGFAGIVTNDFDFVSQPRELAALVQTRLTAVVAESVGHDSIKATGLLLAHLPGICKRITPDRPQAWILRTADKPHTDPWDLFKPVAQRRRRGTEAFYDEHRLSDEELSADPLAGTPKT